VKRRPRRSLPSHTSSLTFYSFSYTSLSLARKKTGTYIDKKCPFTGNVSIRGRILSGVVKSTKMKRTIIIRMDYLHYIKKYQRYEKRHTNLAAHISPCFRCKEGDTVVVGQCRPLSKTVRFNVLKVIAAGSKAGKSFAAN
jgi:small subunit ribosomal protein S11e